MDNAKIQKRNLIMFPLGTVGRDMVYNLVTSYLLTFVLFTRNLNAAQLSAITAIMVAARIFDALNDPVMGNIIERTRTRWGKFKPWLVIGILTTSLVVYATFNVKLQGWQFVWFFGAMYFLYSITYTMHDIAYWGMVPALSSEANMRNLSTACITYAMQEANGYFPAAGSFVYLHPNTKNFKKKLLNVDKNLKKNLHKMILVS